MDISESYYYRSAFTFSINLTALGLLAIIALTWRSQAILILLVSAEFAYIIIVPNLKAFRGYVNRKYIEECRIKGFMGLVSSLGTKEKLKVIRLNMIRKKVFRACSENKNVNYLNRNILNSDLLDIIEVYIGALRKSSYLNQRIKCGNSPSQVNKAKVREFRSELACVDKQISDTENIFMDILDGAMRGEVVDIDD